uniref:Ribosomal protein eL8/eL30/eS12/Gadd45 domain-containing protein n=1 Tax=Ciona savignyi TaxID=51511 RepID=H2YD73_CIOSA
NQSAPTLYSFFPTIEKKTAAKVLNNLTKFFSSHPEVKKAKSAGRKKGLSSGVTVQSNEYRKNFAFGINEVTKALEKGKLSFFLVCQSAKPAVLTQHLALLAGTTGTPSATIPNLSATLLPLLQLKSVLAIGFHKTHQDSDLTETSDGIKAHLSTVTLPWDSLRSEKSNLKRKHEPEATNFIPTKICVNKSTVNTSNVDKTKN